MDWSFCTQLGRGLAPHTRYERGPSPDGYRIRERAARAVEFLRRQSGKRLMLAGYSRGGSAAVIAASMLKAAGRTVDFLFLFDPVARHLSGDTSTIPSNVKEAWVARRMIGAPEMNTTTCGSATGLDTIQCVRSSYPPESAARPVLENIGKNGRFTVRTFTKTHGKGVSAHRMMCLKSEGPQLTLTEMRRKRAKVARSLWHRPLREIFCCGLPCHLAWRRTRSSLRG